MWEYLFFFGVFTSFGIGFLILYNLYREQFSEVYEKNNILYNDESFTKQIGKVHSNNFVIHDSVYSKDHYTIESYPHNEGSRIIFTKK